MADCGITGQSLGVMQAALVRAAPHPPLHPPVLETQCDLKVVHPLPVTLKPEMPGLDDPRMHRPHGHLVDFLAGHPEEVADPGFDFIFSAAASESKRLQPRVAHGPDTPLLRNLTFEPIRLGTFRRQRRVLFRHRGAQHRQVAGRGVGEHRIQAQRTGGQDARIPRSGQDARAPRHAEKRRDAQPFRHGGNHGLTEYIHTGQRHVRQAGGGTVTERKVQHNAHPRPPNTRAAALNTACKPGGT